MTLLILAQALVATLLIATVRGYVGHYRAVAARRAAALEDFAAGRGLGAFRADAAAIQAPVAIDATPQGDAPAAPVAAPVAADSALPRLYALFMALIARAPAVAVPRPVPIRPSPRLDA